MSKCPWARCWTPNFSCCAGQHHCHQFGHKLLKTLVRPHICREPFYGCVLHFFLLSIYLLKQFPFYSSYLGECCNTVLLQSSRNSVHHLEAEQIMTAFPSEVNFFCRWEILSSYRNWSNSVLVLHRLLQTLQYHPLCFLLFTLFQSLLRFIIIIALLRPNKLLQEPRPFSSPRHCKTGASSSPRPELWVDACLFPPGYTLTSQQSPPLQSCVSSVRFMAAVTAWAGALIVFHYQPAPGTRAITAGEIL